MKKINLNSIVYDKRITKETILEYITQERIYSFYIGLEIESGARLNSPLRDDTVPSFGIFYHKPPKSDVLMFYDFATKESGDCITLVSLLFGITYHEALLKVAYDFNLTNVNIPANRKPLLALPKIVKSNVVEIGIKKRVWQVRDKEFWSAFGIKRKTLERFNVYPISYVFFNDNPVYIKELGYAYVEYKDEKISYKIYQPYSKQYKWINNANYSVHQGYTQLPENGDLLIITKSLKDVMSIYDTTGIPSVGLQSESVMMKDSVMVEYKERFKKVICLFDNDTAGKKLATQFSEEFDVPHFFMPEMENVTDYSDLVKEVGIKKAVDILKNKLNNEIKQRQAD
jgi:5S rRNA maturation endonuclease (ribonuclease M5)